MTGIYRTVAKGACRRYRILTDTLRDITDELGIEFYCRHSPFLPLG